MLIKRQFKWNNLYLNVFANIANKVNVFFFLENVENFSGLPYIVIFSSSSIFKAAFTSSCDHFSFLSFTTSDLFFLHKNKGEKKSKNYYTGRQARRKILDFDRVMYRVNGEKLGHLCIPDSLEIIHVTQQNYLLT